MKILISHVYSSNNNGDAAILSAQISELKRVFKSPELNIFTIDTVAADYMFDSVPVFNSLMFGSVSPAHNKLQKLILAWAMMSYTALWAVVFRCSGLRMPLPGIWRKPMELLEKADMQVCVGGGYLRAIDDQVSTIILMLLFHQIWLARFMGKPVYLYAQSFGPYPKKMQQRIAAIGFKNADLILVRESKSKRLLNYLGVDAARVVQVPDSAFLFHPKTDPSVIRILGTKSHGEEIVGITVRAWLRGPAQAKYEKAMADFISRLAQKQSLRVVVIAQVTSGQQNDDDRVVGARIERLLGHRQNVLFLDQQFNHYEIKSIFAQLDYLVGTRFHSVIFALTAGVPALAIEYEHKTSGIMQDLGLGEWVIAIEDVTDDKLMALFERLVHERKAYLRQLNTVLPTYMAQASESVEIIKRAYEQSKYAADSGDRAQRK
jgi:colanic acid/amylovoran biosynthesis protein